VYVGDVVRANLAALEYEGDEEVFNIGTGIETTVLDLLEGIQQAAGTAATPEHRPARLGELSRSALDCARAERELGWTAEVGFGDGLAQTLAELRR
jgi:UDP-glucose 4-epimerase